MYMEYFQYRQVIVYIYVYSYYSMQFKGADRELEM